MASSFVFAAADESDLNRLASGQLAGDAVPWRGRKMLPRIPKGKVGVVWREPGSIDDPVQPLVIVAAAQEHQRLFGRFAQLRSDLSPLSVWCHIVDPEWFAALDDLKRLPYLAGYEAVWVGLIVAEAHILADRPVQNLWANACYATQSFAVARAKALWGQVPVREIIERYDTAHKFFRNGESRQLRLRNSLEIIWECLQGLVSPGDDPGNAVPEIVASLRALQQARELGYTEESVALAVPLRELAPEALMLEELDELTPEQRVQQFDRLIAALEESSVRDDPARQQALSFLAGYLVTVAAGGSPSLSLAEPYAQQWPEITAWAFAIGGIGEHVVWTSSFHGLGRMVARELMRPLRLDEPPSCDFALDEARVVVDPQLSDPLVHLRIKQMRTVSVSLLPGVNVLFPKGEQQASLKVALDRQREPQPRPSRLQNNIREDSFASLADALWPYLRELIESERAVEKSSSSRSTRPSKSRQRKGPSRQTDLPLKGPNKR